DGIRTADQEQAGPADRAESGVDQELQQKVLAHPAGGVIQGLRHDVELADSHKAKEAVPQVVVSDGEEETENQHHQGHTQGSEERLDHVAHVEQFVGGRFHHLHRKGRPARNVRDGAPSRAIGGGGGRNRRRRVRQLLPQFFHAGGSPSYGSRVGSADRLQFLVNVRLVFGKLVGHGNQVIKDHPPDGGRARDGEHHDQQCRGDASHAQSLQPGDGGRQNQRENDGKRQRDQEFAGHVQHANHGHQNGDVPKAGGDG